MEDVLTQTWYSVIVPATTADAAGTVCLWSHEHEGEPINEMGWMVLPEFQGRRLDLRRDALG